MLVLSLLKLNGTELSNLVTELFFKVTKQQSDKESKSFLHQLICDFVALSLCCL